MKKLRRLKYFIFVAEIAIVSLGFYKLAGIKQDALVLHEQAFTVAHLLWQNLMTDQKAWVAPNDGPVKPQEIDNARQSLKEAYKIIWEVLDKEKVTCGQSPNRYGVESMSVVSIDVPMDGVTQGDGQPCTYLRKDPSP